MSYKLPPFDPPGTPWENPIRKSVSDLDTISVIEANKDAYFHQTAPQTITLNQLLLPQTRNYAVNGTLNLWQMNNGTTAAGVPVSSTPSYLGPDKLLISAQNGALVALKRSTDVPNPDTVYSAQVSMIPTGPTQNIQFGHRIESQFSRDFFSQLLNVTFSIKCDTASQVQITLTTPTLQDDFTTESPFFQETINCPNGRWFQVKSGRTIPGIACTLGLGVYIKLINFRLSTSMVNHNLAQLRIHKGKFPSQDLLSAANIEQDQILTQRYFEKSYALNVNPGTATGINVDTATGRSTAGIMSSPIPALPYGEGQNLFSVDYKSQKFKIPRVLAFSPMSGNSGYTYNYTSGSDQPSIIPYTDINYFLHDVGPIGRGESVIMHFIADANL